LNLYVHSQRTQTAGAVSYPAAVARGFLFSPTTFSPYYIVIEPTQITARDIVTGAVRTLATADPGVEYLQCAEECVEPEVNILRNSGRYVLSFLGYTIATENEPATTTPIQVELQ
jgi:hypothetical protein